MKLKHTKPLAHSHSSTIAIHEHTRRIHTHTRQSPVYMLLPHLSVYAAKQAVATANNNKEIQRQRRVLTQIDRHAHKFST